MRKAAPALAVVFVVAAGLLLVLASRTPVVHPVTATDFRSIEIAPVEPAPPEPVEPPVPAEPPAPPVALPEPKAQAVAAPAPVEPAPVVEPVPSPADPPPVVAPPSPVVEKPARKPTPAAKPVQAAAKPAETPMVMPAAAVVLPPPPPPDPEALVRNTLYESKSAFEACYEHSLRRDHDLRGLFEVHMAIRADGKVSKARIVESNVSDNRVTRCILGRLRQLRFPDLGDDVEIQLPMVLVPREM